MGTYLGEAADEAVLSAGAVLAVLAVVEGVRVAGAHAVHADVELPLEAAAQAVAAAGELDAGRGGRFRTGLDEVDERFGRETKPTTYNVDESGEADDDDGEYAHQGAVQPGLDDPSGEGLQGQREQLGGSQTGRKYFSDHFPSQLKLILK